jgi:hypothetical protein
MAVNAQEVDGGLTHSIVLRSKMELTCGALFQALDRMWSHPRLADLFPQFLVLLHQIMRASVPLMEAARERSVALASQGDPLAPGLVSYFSMHIPEERNHDVWALEDLETLGMAASEVLAEVPSPTVASLVGAQYYWLFHHHPAALLGYIAVLEGYPPRGSRIAELQKRTGLPHGAFRTYRKHADLDPYHKAALDRAVDALPLTMHDEGLIGLSASFTAAMLADCIDELSDHLLDVTV